MNCHPWATGKVTILDRWLFIGGSFSGGFRGAPPPPPPRSRFQQQQNAHIWTKYALECTIWRRKINNMDAGRPTGRTETKQLYNSRD